jgi:hypothetical protein
MAIFMSLLLHIGRNWGAFIIPYSWALLALIFEQLIQEWHLRGWDLNYCKKLWLLALG